MTEVKQKCCSDHEVRHISDSVSTTLNQHASISFRFKHETATFYTDQWSNKYFTNNLQKFAAENQKIVIFQQKTNVMMYRTKKNSTD